MSRLYDLIQHAAGWLQARYDLASHRRAAMGRHPAGRFQVPPDDHPERIARLGVIADLERLYALPAHTPSHEQDHRHG